MGLSSEPVGGKQRASLMGEYAGADALKAQRHTAAKDAPHRQGRAAVRTAVVVVAFAATVGTGAYFMIRMPATRCGPKP